MLTCNADGQTKLGQQFVDPRTRCQYDAVRHLFAAGQVQAYRLMLFIACQMGDAALLINMTAKINDELFKRSQTGRGVEHTGIGVISKKVVWLRIKLWKVRCTMLARETFDWKAHILEKVVTGPGKAVIFISQYKQPRRGIKRLP